MRHHDEGSFPVFAHGLELWPFTYDLTVRCWNTCGRYAGCSSPTRRCMPAPYVAMASSERGDVLLRRRESDGALELRVNGVFMMDDRETGTERLLAELALEAAAVPAEAGCEARFGDAARGHGRGSAGRGLTVLVGGLGLGFTLAAVLNDDRVDRVIVAEIEPSLVSWHKQGIVPGSDIGDHRVEVVIGDVRDVVSGVAAHIIDVLLLDVDNGPDTLVHSGNADIYRVSFLLTCREALRERGLLAIWSADSSRSLSESVSDVFGRCDERTLPVRLGRRDTTYHLFLATR